MKMAEGITGMLLEVAAVMDVNKFTECIMKELGKEKQNDQE